MCCDGECIDVNVTSCSYLHGLSSINRALQLRLRDHHGHLLGVIDTIVSQLITHAHAHTKLVWRTSETDGDVTPTTTSTQTQQQHPAVMVKKAIIHSRLLDLPRLAASAGVERR